MLRRRQLPDGSGLRQRSAQGRRRCRGLGWHPAVRSNPRDHKARLMAVQAVPGLSAEGGCYAVEGVSSAEGHGAVPLSAKLQLPHHEGASLTVCTPAPFYLPSLAVPSFPYYPSPPDQNAEAAEQPSRRLILSNEPKPPAREPARRKGRRRTSQGRARASANCNQTYQCKGSIESQGGQQGRSKWGFFREKRKETPTYCPAASVCARCKSHAHYWSPGGA